MQIVEHGFKQNSVFQHGKRNWLQPQLSIFAQHSDFCKQKYPSKHKTVSHEHYFINGRMRLFVDIQRVFKHCF